MRNFVIYSFNKKISIYEEIGETLEALKNKGELEQHYDANLFWNWWKKKVGYQDEEISFLVITDNKEFSISDDIFIAHKNSLSQNIINDVLLRVPINSEVITFPKIENLEIDYTKVEDSKEEKVEIVRDIANPSLATFFRKKTKEMRG